MRDRIEEGYRLALEDLEMEEKGGPKIEEDVPESGRKVNVKMETQGLDSKTLDRIERFLTKLGVSYKITSEETRTSGSQAEPSSPTTPKTDSSGLESLHTAD